MARAHRGEREGRPAGEPAARSRESAARARQGRSGARGARGVGTGTRACVADLDAAGTLLRPVRSTRAVQQLASRATVAGSDWEVCRLRLRRLERGGGSGSPGTPAETRVETQRLPRLPVNALRSACRAAATSRCVSAGQPAAGRPAWSTGAGCLQTGPLRTLGGDWGGDAQETRVAPPAPAESEFPEMRLGSSPGPLPSP